MLLKPTFKFLLLAAGLSIVASDGFAQTTAREYCNRGVAREKKGDLKGALADYSRAIELNPENATAHNNRGLLKMAKGDLEGALADYDRALQFSPGDFKFRTNRGIARQKNGDLDAALVDYNIAIKLWWKYVPAYNGRASLKLAKNDLDGALADCNVMLKINPKDASAYYTRSLVDAAKGDLEAATADFNRAIKLNPKYARNSPAALNIGNVESAGSPDENLPITPDATNPGTGENRELATQKKDDPSSARSEPGYAPPTEIEPKNIPTVYDSDVAKRKEDNPNQAPVVHKPAIEVPPKTVDVRDEGNVDRKTSVPSAEPSPTIQLPSKSAETSIKLELGKPITGKLGSRLAAARDAGLPSHLTLSDGLNLSKQNHNMGSPAVDRSPAQPTVPSIPNQADLAKLSKSDLNIAPADRSPAAEPDKKPPADANVSTQKDNPSRASTDYPPASGRDPTTTAGYRDRAYLRSAIGDLDGALADYNRVIQLHPDAAAYNGRGSIKKAKHDLDGALADYNRAIELSGGNAVAYYNRGITKQTKGDLDGAIADLNPAIELDPKNASAYHSRGGAKAMKGDLDGALADYNRAIELNPKSAATYYNRGDLFFSIRNWDGALDDYNRFFDLSQEGQEDPRFYVWLILARTGKIDAANKDLGNYLEQRGNTADWFSKEAHYLLGRISEANLLAAAKSSDKKTENGQLCEAWFYIGMKKLIGGDKHGAQDCFNKSVSTDQKDYSEYHFARAELKALRN